MTGRISGGSIIRHMLRSLTGTFVRMEPADEESSRSRAWHRPADEDVSSLQAGAAGSQKRGCGEVGTDLHTVVVYNETTRSEHRLRHLIQYPAHASLDAAHNQH